MGPLHVALQREGCELDCAAERNAVAQLYFQNVTRGCVPWRVCTHCTRVRTPGLVPTFQARKFDYNFEASFSKSNA
jgi:hypothetical protein